MQRINDIQRIRQLLSRLHSFRARAVSHVEVSIHAAAVQAIEAEIGRLVRRVDRHLREGLVVCAADDAGSPWPS